MYTNKRACPSSNVIRKMLKDPDFEAMSDSKGRLYGILQKEDTPTSTYLLNSLKESGRIDNKKLFLFWVLLPFHTLDVYSRKEESKDLLIGEELSFPEIDDIFSLKAFATDNYVHIVQAIAYPQRRSSKARTDCIILHIVE
jgi:hypothetical protein